MRHLRFILIATVIFPSAVIPVSAKPGPRNEAATKPLKFLFGAGGPVTGYTEVSGSTPYSTNRGFGFEPGANVDCRGEGGKSRRGSCRSAQPFLFSVAVPEGNFRVTVILGDTHDPSNTTIKAESRRLMVEGVPTRSGEFVQRTFTVNVRNAHLPDGRTVALKPREQDSFTWDDKLTLEFNGTNPSVSALIVEFEQNALTVFLAGDSTVTDQADEPWASWGQMLPRFFNAKVAIANYAESGESLRSFRAERRRDKLFGKLSRGDYLFIQFAHNDQKPGPSHLDALTDYEAELKGWIAEARSRGAVPVLVTSMHRRTFGADGKIVNSLGDYPRAMREVAAADRVALIDLNTMSAQFYEALGPTDSTRAFVHYAAHTFPGQDQALADHTHFNAYGAYELAKCVVQDIGAARLPLLQYLLDRRGNFDPARPAPWSDFAIPASPFRQLSKPAGN